MQAEARNGRGLSQPTANCGSVLLRTETGRDKARAGPGSPGSWLQGASSAQAALTFWFEHWKSHIPGTPQPQAKRGTWSLGARSAVPS